MNVLRISSLATGLLGILIAILLVGVESVLDAWWALASIFSGGMLGLFLLGFVVKRSGRTEAITGVILGVILIIWMSLSPLVFSEGNMPAFRSPFHSNLTIVFGTMTIFLAGFLLTSLTKKKRR